MKESRTPEPAFVRFAGDHQLLVQDEASPLIQPIRDEVGHSGCVATEFEDDRSLLRLDHCEALDINSERTGVIATSFVSSARRTDPAHRVE